jgi:hypothetical protein
MIVPLNLIEPNGSLLSDSIMLFQNLSRVALVSQVQFQWNSIFNYHISRELHTSFVLGYVEYGVITR